jgi:hypothetical protein
LNMVACRDFVAARQTARDQQCAWICADMQLFGNFSAGVPEIRRAGFILPCRQPQSGPGAGHRLRRINCSPVGQDLEVVRSLTNKLEADAALLAEALVNVSDQVDERDRAVRNQGLSILVVVA